MKKAKLLQRKGTSAKVRPRPSQNNAKETKERKKDKKKERKKEMSTPLARRCGTDQVT